MRLRSSTAASILLVLLFTGACADPAPKSSDLSVDLQEAVSISNAFLVTLGRNPDELKLVKAENVIYPGTGTSGPAIWRLDYLERDRIPTEEHRLVGAGGGLFIEVDLETRKAKFLGVGE